MLPRARGGRAARGACGEPCCGVPWHGALWSVRPFPTSAPWSCARVPDFRAVGLRAVVLRAVALRAVALRAVALRAVALRAGLAAGFSAADLPPPDTAFSASLASLRAVFNHEALPLRRFAGSFLICFSMVSSVVP